MKVNIYGIINPITKEIVYIGQTPSNLDYYIKTKYWKLNEVKRGKRNWNKLFHFLNNLLPIKAEITLLKICDTEKPFNDPMAIKRNIGIYYKNELVCKCNYAFEINEFFNKQIWSNIYKYIKCNCPYNYKGYIIKRII